MAYLVVLVVVILGLINGGYCQETAQEAPWRIHTLFSMECHNYLFRVGCRHPLGGFHGDAQNGLQLLCVKSSKRALCSHIGLQTHGSFQKGKIPDIEKCLDVTLVT